MKNEFKSVSTLTDLPLPLSAKSQIWKSGYATNLTVLDIFSKLSPHYAENLGAAEEFTRNILKRLQAINHFADEFFLSKKIPDEIIYATVAKKYVDFHTEKFPNLPNAYFQISNEIEEIDSLPHLINSKKISVSAKFVHNITGLMEIESFLDRIRCDEIELRSGVFNDMYDDLVNRAKMFQLSETGLSATMVIATRGIDCIVNNANNSNHWYIPYAALFGRKAIDTHGIVELHDLPDTPRVHSALQMSYKCFADQYETPCVDGFYEFAEQVINPLLFMRLNSMEQVTEKHIVFAIIEPIIDCEDSIFDAGDFGGDIQIMNTIHRRPFAANDCDQRHDRIMLEIYKMAHCASDLYMQSHYLWGNIVTPYIFPSDLKDFHTMLKSSESVTPLTAAFRDTWKPCLDRAYNRYNYTIPEFGHERLPVYSPS